MILEYPKKGNSSYHLRFFMAIRLSNTEYLPHLIYPGVVFAY